MGELDALGLADEHQRVLADDVTAAQGHDADLVAASRTDFVAVGLADRVELPTGGIGHGLPDAQGGARWRVAFVAVVNLEHLGVPVGAECFGRGPRQVNHERDAHRVVGSSDDRNLAAGFDQSELGLLAEAGGAEHQRDPAFHAAGQVGLGGLGQRKVDDDVVASGEQLVAERDADAALADQWPDVFAQARSARTSDGSGERHGIGCEHLGHEALPHATARADDDDGSESLVHQVSSNPRRASITWV